MYKTENGLSISKYCKLNNIPYECIWRRVALEKMTPEEAINDYNVKKTKPKYCKFWYKGMTLRKYCAKHGLKYQQLIDYKRFYDLTLEQAVEKFLTKKK